MAFTTLAHLIDVGLLREAYRRTRKDGAPGIDGVTAQEYAEHLEANLANLNERLRSGGFQPSSDRSSSWFPLTQNLAKRAMVRSTISLDLETMIDFRLNRPNQ
jgi:hypothetical protein